MKNVLIVAAALLAGLGGGVLGGLLVRAREREQPVRARSFELLDKAGRVISFWGVDQEHNAVLAFGSRGLAVGDRQPSDVPSGIDNPLNQLTSFGLESNDTPLLKMSGSDGTARVRLYLLDGKPILLMGDETGPRLSLGFDQTDTPGPENNDWALEFSQDRAVIGVMSEKREGQTYVRGVFNVNRDPVKYPFRVAR